MMINITRNMLMNNTSKLKKAQSLIQKCGIWHGSKLIIQAMWRRIYPPARRKRQQWQQQLRDDAAFDQAFGIETCGDHWLGDAGVPITEIARGNGIYRPVGQDLFEHGFSKLDLDFSTYTFVDYGSGKGKAIFLACDYPFLKIIGIEYAPDLHHIAESNIKRYRNPKQKCHQIRSVLADATRYDPPLDPLVCFFFNPFDNHTLAQVLDKLYASWQSTKRSIWLVSVNRRNIKESLPTFDSRPYLQKRYLDRHAGIFEFKQY